MGTVSTAECLGLLPTLSARSYLSPGRKSALSELFVSENSTRVHLAAIQALFAESGHTACALPVAKLWAATVPHQQDMLLWVS